MSEKFYLSSSPHIHSKNSTQRIMLDVVISLLPALVAGTIIFGTRALLVVAVCIASCVALEWIFNAIVKKPQTITDLSAVVTGLLLGLNLPANIPVWQCIIGSIFAIIIVKCVFGGIGKNIVNPAVSARVFMTIAFASLATPAFPLDSTSTATPLVELSESASLSAVDLFFGNYGGAIGETCTLALLIGGIYLICRNVITWHIPVIFIGTVFVLSYFYGDMSLNFALCEILSGGLFIGAIFMATDYVTSPATAWGKVIFAVFAGLITCMIRFYGNYPEGVSFAILLANIVDPYIDKWTTRKLFGGDR